MMQHGVEANLRGQLSARRAVDSRAEARPQNSSFLGLGSPKTADEPTKLDEDPGGLEAEDTEYVRDANLEAEAGGGGNQYVRPTGFRAGGLTYIEHR